MKMHNFSTLLRKNAVYVY